MKFLKDLDKESFRVLFRAFIATVSLMFAGAYTWNVTFIAEGEKVSKHGEFILGFLLGTLVATLYNYYFGGNENDQTKTNGNGGNADSKPGGDSPNELLDSGEVVSREDT